jgi:hypothetical protein
VSLSQSLDQLAAFHDGSAQKEVWFAGDSRARRTATHQVSWELHRASEILHQVSESVASAHNAEAQVTYTHRNFPAFAEPPERSIDRGLGL